MKLNKAEKIMKTAGLFYAVSFIIAALIFIFFSEFLFRYINHASSNLFSSLPPAEDSGKFWLSMAVSMMIGVTITSLLIFKDVKKYHSMAIPLIVMKFGSSIMGLSFFIAGIMMPETKWNTLANLLICFTDAPLGLFMLILYKANMRALPAC